MEVFAPYRGKGDEPATLRVATERIWLRSPIHVASRRGEAVEVVLRPFVIGDHKFLCRQAARLRAVRRNLRFTVEGQAT